MKYLECVLESDCIAIPRDHQHRLRDLCQQPEVQFSFCRRREPQAREFRWNHLDTPICALRVTLIAGPTATEAVRRGIVGNGLSDRRFEERAYEEAVSKSSLIRGIRLTLGSFCVITMLSFMTARCSLPIPRPPRSGRAGFFLARVCSVDGIRIPPLALVVPDHRREIQPNNDILGTMLLSLGFVSKGLERKRRNGERHADY
jgi:hypothetical protein